MTSATPIDAALRRRLADQVCRESLYAFVMRCVETLNPGRPFTHGMHMEAMCYALEKCARGVTRRLVISVPPRYGKSICASIALPAWLLGRQPSKKIMVASYGSDLANEHANGFRKIMASAWYRQVMPNARIAVGANRVDEQKTTRGGGRKAVSLGGAATGFGADVIIVDDLIKASDANSPAELKRATDYFEQTLLSRLDSQKDGVVIVIAQRLHEDDVPGRLLASGGYEHLILPAIAVEDQTIPAGPSRYFVRSRNQALWPIPQPLSVLERLRLEMGDAAFSAQYQQDPTPPGGNRIRWEWFGIHDLVDPVREDFQHVVQSWDTGFSAEPTSDFSVGMTWGLKDKKWYLVDLIRARLDFADLKSRAQFWARGWRVDTVIIEAKGSGIPLLQQLRQDERTYRHYVRYQPREDKSTRVEAQSGRLQTGNYLLPRTAPYLIDLRSELNCFPNARHDDQVDALIQFVNWSAGPRGQNVVERDPITGRIARLERPAQPIRPIGLGPRAA